jgi:hypothetical protein
MVVRAEPALFHSLVPIIPVVVVNYSDIGFAEALVRYRLAHTTAA